MHTAISLPYRWVSLVDRSPGETPDRDSFLDRDHPDRAPIRTEMPLDRDPLDMQGLVSITINVSTCLSSGDNDPTIPLTPKHCNSVPEGLWHCTFTVLPIQLLRWFNWLATLSMSLVMGKTSKMFDPSVKNNLSGSTPATIETNLPIQSGQIILLGVDEPPLTQHS